MIATERSVNYLKRYAKNHFIRHNSGENTSNFLRKIGLSDADFDQLLLGEMLLDEPRFYRLLEYCREYDYSGARGQYPDWFIETPNWELVGMVGRSLSLRKLSGEEVHGIQGIVKAHTVIVDDEKLLIEEGDTLIRSLDGGLKENLYVCGVECNRYQERLPAYVIEVRRCSFEMVEQEKHSSVNNYIGDNSNVNVVTGNNSSILTMENKTDNVWNMECLHKIWEWLKKHFWGSFVI